MDETFLQRMILVLMDLPSGYLLMEEVAEDRTYATWKALVDTRLEALAAEVLYLVSDRAKALIQLAQQGLGCLSIPDFFHLVRDIGKSCSLAIALPLRAACKELGRAQEALRKYQGSPPQRLQAQEAAQQVSAAP